MRSLTNIFCCEGNRDKSINIQKKSWWRRKRRRPIWSIWAFDDRVGLFAFMFLLACNNLCGIWSLLMLVACWLTHNRSRRAQASAAVCVCVCALCFPVINLQNFSEDPDSDISEKSSSCALRWMRLWVCVCVCDHLCEFLFVCVKRVTSTLQRSKSHASHWAPCWVTKWIPYHLESGLIHSLKHTHARTHTWTAPFLSINIKSNTPLAKRSRACARTHALMCMLPSCWLRSNC